MIRISRNQLNHGPYSLRAGSRWIGLFDVAGKVYAIDNICPHADALLTLGRVRGEVVECPLHNARFHLPTGRCLSGPGRNLATYPVEADGEDLLVEANPATKSENTN